MNVYRQMLSSECADYLIQGIPTLTFEEACAGFENRVEVPFTIRRNADEPSQ